MDEAREHLTKAIEIFESKRVPKREAKAREALTRLESFAPVSPLRLPSARALQGGFDRV